jgi:hypothetical protein
MRRKVHATVAEDAMKIARQRWEMISGVEIFD